jgi:hypothetical protein
VQLFTTLKNANILSKGVQNHIEKKSQEPQHHFISWQPLIKNWRPHAVPVFIRLSPDVILEPNMVRSAGGINRENVQVLFLE